MWFDSGLLRARVYQRARMPAGLRIRGPAIVVQMDSTSVVAPGWQATVDGSGNLILETTG